MRANDEISQSPELNHSAASGAYEVMMVPGVAKVPFISVGAIIEVDLAQDSHILKKLEGAVDCDKAYIRLRPRYRLEHLLCRQMSGAVLKEKKD